MRSQDTREAAAAIAEEAQRQRGEGGALERMAENQRRWAIEITEELREFSQRLDEIEAERDGGGNRLGEIERRLSELERISAGQDRRLFDLWCAVHGERGPAGERRREVLLARGPGAVEGEDAERLRDQIARASGIPHECLHEPGAPSSGELLGRLGPACGDPACTHERCNAIRAARRREETPIVRPEGRGELDRDAWTALRSELRGPDDDVRIDARVSDANATIEFRRDSAPVSVVDVYGAQGATEIRIGALEFYVARSRLVVLRQDGGFPIGHWTVLYDGPIRERGGGPWSGAETPERPGQY